MSLNIHEEASPSIISKIGNETKFLSTDIRFLQLAHVLYDLID